MLVEAKVTAAKEKASEHTRAISFGVLDCLGQKIYLPSVDDVIVVIF